MTDLAALQIAAILLEEELFADLQRSMMAYIENESPKKDLMERDEVYQEVIDLLIKLTD